MPNYRGHCRGGNLPPIFVGINGQDHMDMVGHNAMFIYGNSRIMLRDLQNCRFYDSANFRKVRAAGCRPYIPKNRFSVIYADCNEICSGRRIIVICNTDRFAFGNVVHNVYTACKCYGNTFNVFISHTLLFCMVNVKGLTEHTAANVLQLSAVAVWKTKIYSKSLRMKAVSSLEIFSSTEAMAVISMMASALVSSPMLSTKWSTRSGI